MEMHLEPQEIAQSLFRAVNKAMTAASEDPTKEVEDWDRLSLEQQAPFLALAARGPAMLQQLEGLKIQDAAMRLYAKIKGIDENLAQEMWIDSEPAFRLSWELMVRHLAMLLDSDEVTDLPSAEEQWVVWYKRRLEREVLVR